MPSRRTTIALLAALLTLVLALVVGRDSARLLSAPFPGFSVWDNGMLVAFHRASWTGVVAGLPLNGGRLLEVDGQPFPGGRAFLEDVARRPPGTLIEYRVLHGGVERSLAVPSMQLSAGDYWSTFGNYLINAVVFAFIGIIALWLRPDRRAARALALVMLTMAALFALAIDFLATYRFVRICQLVEALTPATIAHFALVFPSERLAARTRRGILGALVAVGVGLWLASASTFYASPELARRFTDAVYLMMAVIPMLMIIGFVQVFTSSRAPEERARVAIVAAGATVALLAPAVAMVAFFVLGWSFSFTWITASLPLFPASILYAVVRHDLLEAERFARLTLGYGAATATVVLSYAFLLSGIDRFAVPGASQSPAASFALLIAIALLFDPLRRRIQARVDRVFYRSSLDAARVLESASAELTARGEESGIVAAMEERLSSALATDWVRFDLPHRAASDAALSADVAFRGELLGRLACGTKRSGAPFSDDERELLNGLAQQLALALHNARSLRALHEAETALLRAERLAAIGELAGAVAHGMRNPLAGIRASAQISLEKVTDRPAAEALADLIDEVDRLDQRVRTLLDFSRPFQPQLRRVEIGDVLRSVREALQGQARRQGVKIELRVPEPSPSLDVDPDHLEEALLELSANALRAMPDGGRLTLSAEAHDNAVRLLVSDTGHGIPPGVQDRVFDLFFTTRADGTGMGLATVQKVVERMSGRLLLASSSEQGTTFQIELAQGIATT